MDLKTAIEGRRSIREFLNEAVPEKDIREIVQLGTMAPNAANMQDWRFIAVTNQEKKAQMKKMLQEKLVHLARETGKEDPERFGQTRNFVLYGDAPLALAVLTKPFRSKLDNMLLETGFPEEELDKLRMRPDIQTVSAAIQNILLASYELGYGSCWMVAPTLVRREIESYLGVEPPWALAAIIAIGKPAKQPPPKKLKPLDEILQIIP